MARTGTQPAPRRTLVQPHEQARKVGLLLKNGLGQLLDLEQQRAGVSERLLDERLAQAKHTEPFVPLCEAVQLTQAEDDILRSSDVSVMIGVPCRHRRRCHRRRTSMLGFKLATSRSFARLKQMESSVLAHLASVYSTCQVR